VDDNDKISECLPGALYLWKSLYDQHGDDLTLLQMASGLFEHADPKELAAQLQLQERRAIVTCLWDCLHADDRRKRIAVGYAPIDRRPMKLTVRRALAIVYSAQASHPSQKVAIGNRKSMIAKINGTASALPRVQESAILLLGEFARLAKEEDLGDLLEPLIVRLGSASAPLRSAAYTQVSLTLGVELIVDPRYQSIKRQSAV
jgi:hypothetical protein